MVALILTLESIFLHRKISRIANLFLFKWQEPFIGNTESLKQLALPWVMWKACCIPSQESFFPPQKYYRQDLKDCVILLPSERFVLAWFLLNTLFLDSFHSFSDSLSKCLLNTYYGHSRVKYWGHSAVTTLTWSSAFNGLSICGEKNHTEQVIARVCYRAEINISRWERALCEHSPADKHERRTLF